MRLLHWDTFYIRRREDFLREYYRRRAEFVNLIYPPLTRSQWYYAHNHIYNILRYKGREDSSLEKIRDVVYEHVHLTTRRFIIENLELGDVKRHARDKWIMEYYD